MGVAKMKYLNVYGPEHKLLPALGAIAACGSFAPEEEETLRAAVRFGTNRYEPLLTKAKGLLADLDEGTIVEDFDGNVEDFDLETVADYLEKYAGEVASISKRRTQLENELALYTKTEDLVQHMGDLDINFDELFKVDYLKIRIGRLPKNSFVRLSYYAKKQFNFTNYFNFSVYDFDGEYYWGLYFAPADRAKEIDEIFSSLYFERTRIPEFVHGEPAEALVGIKQHIKELQQSLNDLIDPPDIAAEQELNIIKRMASWLAYTNQLYEMERFALVFNRTFYINGFVAEDDYDAFAAAIKQVGDVSIKQAGHEKEIPADPPVKLKNNWFARPYEMFTTMYGLPTYHDIDPTFIVSVIYSVLYGLMFADLGQGIVLGLFGYFYMYKRRGLAIGPILARAGFFSALFGLFFGSVFGYEHLLDPLWHALGFEEKPFEVLASASINTILIVSVGIGVLIVTMAIALGIFSKLRRGLRGQAITSPNGLAGLVFYLAAIGFALDLVVLNKGYSSNPAYIIGGIVLPLLVMYMQEPLAELIDGQKPHITSISDLLVGGFFELFVTLLEYVSNTVSFLRVGGFVLAHAGMMSVVTTLAGMAGGASPVVMLVGNIFVICLEGLIVGIQALRLNYYELFSRFYEADGAQFEPLVLKPDTVEL
ncbi:hypothetical protein LJC61_08745 [Ruminococcaceae bacterium OttesenSCG-928-A16]|nr:hypothetical protein [Ruminococcaceae bacterium OttesenSCG-928-A16]